VVLLACSRCFREAFIQYRWNGQVSDAAQQRAKHARKLVNSSSPNSTPRLPRAHDVLADVRGECVPLGADSRNGIRNGTGWRLIHN